MEALRSAHDSFKKYVAIHNCLTIASTSYKYFFRYVGVPEKLLSLATNLSTVPLKLFLTVPAVNEPSLILWIAKFIE